MRVKLGKNKRGPKEYTKEQRLAKENRELKQELGYLRKQIARLDNGRFETLREMVADQEESERVKESLGPVGSSLDRLKADWACRQCSGGHLEITLYSKCGLTWYFRSCNLCKNRTPGKRYDAETVKGIIKS